MGTSKFFHDSSKIWGEIRGVTRTGGEKGIREKLRRSGQFDDLRPSPPVHGFTAFRLRISVGTPPDLPDFLQFGFSSAFVAPLLPPTDPLLEYETGNATVPTGILTANDRPPRLLVLRRRA